MTNPNFPDTPDASQIVRRGPVRGDGSRAGFTPPPPITLRDPRRNPHRKSEPCAADRRTQPVALSGGSASPQSAPAPRPSPDMPWRKRLAVLCAIIAVPAMVSPGDFGALAGNAAPEHVDARAAAALETALAFEVPGMSFPGSAFYYLADPPPHADALMALPDSDPLARGAQGDREIGALIDAGPAARAFSAGLGSGFSRARDCLAQAVYYEAASESEAGQRAVAQVVLNRVAHPAWPQSVCGVVYQGAERRIGCQFSFTCDGSLARRAGGASWARAQSIAGEALAGSVYAPVGHATHYHTLWVDPYWARTLDHVGTIGAHRFYRNRGSAGEKTAFSAAYAGEEPLVAGRNLAISDAARAPARIAVQVPLDEFAAQPKAAPSPPDTAISTGVRLADPSFNAAGTARREYARAGQWKVDPAQIDAEKSALASPRAPKSGDAGGDKDQRE